MTVPIRLQEVPLAEIDLAETAAEMAAAPDRDRLAASPPGSRADQPALAPVSASPAGTGLRWSPGPGALRPRLDLGWQAIRSAWCRRTRPDFCCLLVH